MVPLLIDLRRTVGRHQREQGRGAWLLVGGVLGLVAAVGSLAFGVVRSADPAVGTNVLALVFALWLGGRLAQTTMRSDDGLRPELFAVLGVPRRRLSGPLLIVGLLDPGLIVLAIAFGGVVAFGAHAGAMPAIVGCVAVLLVTLFAGVASTVTGALVAPGSRRGRDAGTIVVATIISVIALAGTLMPELVAALHERSVSWLSDALRILPSGWAPDAVAAAARADWVMVIAPLAGLAVLTALAVLVWPVVLTRRMSSASLRAGGTLVREHATRHRVLPRCPTGAVAGKELRMWVRDPIRLTCLVIAFVVGTGVAITPQVVSGTAVLMPFGGAIAAAISAACACNLYGNDGRALCLTVMTPHSAKPDIRGRQVGWLLATAPFAVGATLVLTALSGQTQQWPWALALVTAVLGGGAGFAPLASLVAPEPLDDTGNPTPAWSLRIHVAVVVVPLTALPTLLVLLAGWQWAALAVAVATGLMLAIGLGRRAATRLGNRQVAILARLAGAP